MPCPCCGLCGDCACGYPQSYSITQNGQIVTCGQTQWAMDSTWNYSVLYENNPSFFPVNVSLLQSMYPGCRTIFWQDVCQVSKYCSFQCGQYQGIVNTKTANRVFIKACSPPRWVDVSGDVVTTDFFYQTSRPCAPIIPGFPPPCTNPDPPCDDIPFCDPLYPNLACT
jgi:hypothetical protein